MERRIVSAMGLLRLARELADGKELVIIPYGGRTDGGPREIESGDDGSNIGNRTDRSFPYEIWAIDLKSMDESSPEFSKVRSLIRRIQGSQGKKWILWTSRSNVDELERLCRENHLVPDAVNDNIDEVKEYYDANSRKVYAHHYIDMRNVGIGDVSRATKPRNDGKKTVYAIDFDGTIAETDRTFPQIEKPIDKMVDFIRNVIQPDPNKEWILYTCRVGEAEKIAERWCRENGLEPSAVNSNARNHGDRKLNADYYIDGRNVDLSKMEDDGTEGNSLVASRLSGHAGKLVASSGRSGKRRKFLDDVDKAIKDAIDDANRKLSSWDLPFDLAVERIEDREFEMELYEDEDDEQYGEALANTVYSIQGEAGVVPLSFNIGMIRKWAVEEEVPWTQVENELNITVWHEVGHAIMDRFFQELLTREMEDEELDTLMDDEEKAAEDFGQAKGRLDGSDLGKWIKKNSDDGYSLLLEEE